ncbi:hypothetical protein B0H19DRAFT_95397 [Mycena capillaripes]|nr:hypothetical protein B0H19DRAFT_95397 [Mycena capillaripes]
MDFRLAPKSPPPPFAKDRRGWNTTWENKLSPFFGSGVEILSASGPLQIKPSIFAAFPPGLCDELLTDSFVAQITDLRSCICRFQLDLPLKSCKKLAEDDFEARWMKQCSQSEREEFILEGLVRTCEVASERYRQWCPELTLQRLNHSSGKGFTELLKKLCYQDTDKVSDDYQTVPKAVFEKMVSFDGPNPIPVAWLSRGW